MIAPTSRAILIAAAGAPISLLLAALAPAAWPLGPAWALAVIALVVADARLARANAGLKVETDAPPMTGIGAGDVKASFYLTFDHANTTSAEVSLETNEFLSPSPARRTVAVIEGYAQTAFNLTPHRRGTGIIENAYIRWQGPLGLAWCQRISALNTTMAVTPDFDSVEREAEKLFSRTQVHGLKPMKDRGDGSEFDAIGAMAPNSTPSPSSNPAWIEDLSIGNSPPDTSISSQRKFALNEITRSPLQSIPVALCANQLPVPQKSTAPSTQPSPWPMSD